MVNVLRFYGEAGGELQPPLHPPLPSVLEARTCLVFLQEKMMLLKIMFFETL